MQLGYFSEQFIKNSALHGAYILEREERQIIQ
jgi:hypothetical protein